MATWSRFLDPVWVGVFPGGHGLISWRPVGALSADDLDALIARAVAAFAGRRLTSLEWKVRHHDEQPLLHERLLAAGFEAGADETIMMGEAAALAAGDVRHEVVAVGERGDALADLQRIHDLQLASLPQMRRERPAVVPAVVPAMFFVAAGEQVVGAGRIETIPGNPVAFLYGGVVHPDHRGRGIYRALLVRRAHVALERGCEFISSDCTEYSRPILAASGLRAVSTTAPYVLTADRLPG